MLTVRILGATCKATSRRNKTTPAPAWMSTGSACILNYLTLYFIFREHAKNIYHIFMIRYTCTAAGQKEQ